MEKAAPGSSLSISEFLFYSIYSEYQFERISLPTFFELDDLEVTCFVRALLWSLAPALDSFWRMGREPSKWSQKAETGLET
jgi:hypothetical protein